MCSILFSRTYSATTQLMQMCVGWQLCIAKMVLRDTGERQHQSKMHLFSYISGVKLTQIGACR